MDKFIINFEIGNLETYTVESSIECYDILEINNCFKKFKATHNIRNTVKKLDE